MAGGEGTRLRPLTSNQPKPMLPMANRPMMEHVVGLLRQHGYEDIVVTGAVSEADKGDLVGQALVAISPVSVASGEARNAAP